MGFNMNSDREGCFVAFVTLLSLFIGFIMGGSVVIKSMSSDIKRAKEAMEIDAVESGAGEYHIDENHSRQFRWKNCE